MVPHDYERRGRRTLIIILILRLLPTFLILLVLLGLAVSKGVIVQSFKTASPESLQAIDSLFSYIAFGGVILFTFLLFVLFIAAFLEYYGLSFMFDQGGFKTRKGIFHLNEQSIPFQQIQNVDIKRPLLYRFLGVSRMVILTAGRDDIPSDGHDSNSIVIDLIDKYQAEEIHDELLKLSHQQADYHRPHISQ
jgi:uncharacterized membrane protein YdbT with pleckstrin-like domain